MDRIVVTADAVALHLRDVDGMDENRRAGDPQDAGAQEPPPAPLSLPWTSGGFAAVKGVLYAPALGATMTPETSGALLVVIAKARSWIADLVAGRAADFAQIAHCEGKVERHVRPENRSVRKPTDLKSNSWYEMAAASVAITIDRRR